MFQNGRHTDTHTTLNVEVPAYKYAAPKNHDIVKHKYRNNSAESCFLHKYTLIGYNVIIISFWVVLLMAFVVI